MSALLGIRTLEIHIHTTLLLTIRSVLGDGVPPRTAPIKHPLFGAETPMLFAAHAKLSHSCGCRFSDSALL